MAQTRVFLREATGLVRGFSATDALILAIANIIGPAWVPVFAGEWYTFPGVNIPLSFVIIGILGLFQGLYYVLITTAMPRSGGGSYVPLSRTIHPLLGMVMTSILVVALMLDFGLTTNIMVTVGVASPLAALGTITSNAALQNLGKALSLPTWALAVGTLVIVLIGLVAIAGPRTISWVNRIMFVIGTLGMVTMAIVLATSSQPQFQSALDSFAGSGTYQNITATAHANGWSIPSNFITPTLLSLPLSFFALIGYQSNTYYSGEIKRVNRNMTFAMVFSIIYTGAFYSILAFLMQTTFGQDFITSAGFLFNATQKYPLTFAPWVNNFMAVLNTNPLVNGLVILSFIGFGYLILISFYIMVSRHFLAWSFDRTIPSAFGAVSERFHTPVRATIITGVVAWIALIFYIYGSTIVGTVNLAAILIVAFMLDGLAGVAIVRKKGIFDSTPEGVRRRVAGIPVISILGLFSFIFMAALFVACLYNPAITGPFGLSSALTVVIAVILGVVSYLGMKTYLKGRGIDISLAFKEIPPE